MRVIRFRSFGLLNLFSQTRTSRFRIVGPASSRSEPGITVGDGLAAGGSVSSLSTGPVEVGVGTGVVVASPEITIVGVLVGSEGIGASDVAVGVDVAVAVRVAVAVDVFCDVGVRVGVLVDVLVGVGEGDAV